MNSNYLSILNEPQRNAVLQTEGPVMIIAGAGSGKTRVLTYRIAHLIEKGIDPFNILSLTFTNKAAREMRERIEKVIGNEAKNIWMGTFHSVFAKILRIEANKIGYPQNFTIYDTDDCKSLIKSILKDKNLDDKLYKPAMVLSRISNAKNNLVTADMYLADLEVMNHDYSTGRKELGAIYKVYEERCFKASAMDFDDLLLKMYQLLKNHADVLNKYQHKFKYVMVDEYQDTNVCQYMIVKKLAAVSENICVVGDDAQSIYSFRGATIRNILNFESDYPTLNVFKLEQNYRSTQTIVNAASSIIKNNKDQLKKKVWTDNDLGAKIKVIRAINDNEEGKYIAQHIFEEKMQHHLNNNDFAILYRTNAQSRSFEEALRKLNIPYRIYGGMSFYQRKEVKDLIAYMRIVNNPNDDEAIKRVINYPTRGIGQTTIDKLIIIGNEQGLGLWEILENIDHIPQLKSSSSKLIDFRNMIKAAMIFNQTHLAYDTVSYLAKSSGISKLLFDDKTIEGKSRYENIVELINGIKEFVEDDTNENEKTLSFFLQDIALLTDNDKVTENKDTVSLMTIHSSKGLEFPQVFVVGLEENLFPSQMALTSRKDLEEERRLFYVAITRAEKKLTLSYATSRYKFGTLTPCEASRFLDEIDETYLDLPTKNHLNPHSEIAQTTASKMILGKPLQRKIDIPQPILNFEPDHPSVFKIDQIIEHQRFGIGKINHIEGVGEHAKANVIFDKFGEKSLVLKFAKMRVVS